MPDEHVIGPYTSLIECMRRINDWCQQLLPVVDENRLLLGVVADGDIRRAILRKSSLEQIAQDFMNKDPVVINSAQWDLGNALYMLREHGLRWLPFVDGDGRFLEMLTLERLIRFQARNTPVVLMAGGLGSRLAPLTDEIPKPMLPVGGRPLIEYIVDQFVRQGFRRFIFSVNYKKEIIENHFGDGSAFGASINYIEEDARLGTAGALTLLPENMESPFIVMNGDILTTLNFGDLVEAHLNGDAMATMAVKSHSEHVPYGVVTVDESGYLLGFEEKPLYSFNISAGINVFSREVRSAIPSGKYFDMPELYQELLSNGAPVKIYALECYWRDIGNLNDYKQAKTDIFDLISSGSD